jgi:hypothetical protein
MQLRISHASKLLLDCQVHAFSASPVRRLQIPSQESGVRVLGAPSFCHAGPPPSMNYSPGHVSETRIKPVTFIAPVAQMQANSASAVTSGACGVQRSLPMLPATASSAALTPSSINTQSAMTSINSSTGPSAVSSQLAASGVPAPLFNMSCITCYVPDLDLPPDQFGHATPLLLSAPPQLSPVGTVPSASAAPTVTSTLPSATMPVTSFPAAALAAPAAPAAVNPSPAIKRDTHTASAAPQVLTPSVSYFGPNVSAISANNSAAAVLASMQHCTDLGYRRWMMDVGPPLTMGVANASGVSPLVPTTRVVDKASRKRQSQPGQADLYEHTETWMDMPEKRQRADAAAGVRQPAHIVVPVARSSACTRALPDRAVLILKTWMLSPEHVDHPYPTDTEKRELAAVAGITIKQLSIWFTNARKRIWVPLRQRQGKAAPTYVDSCLQRKLGGNVSIGGDGAGERSGPIPLQLEVADHCTTSPIVAQLVDGPCAIAPHTQACSHSPPPLEGAHTLAELEAASVALHSQKAHLHAMLYDLEQQETRVRTAAALFPQ